MKKERSPDPLNISLAQNDSSLQRMRSIVGQNSSGSETVEGLQRVASRITSVISDYQKKV